MKGLNEQIEVVMRPYRIIAENLAKTLSLISTMLKPFNAIAKASDCQYVLWNSLDEKDVTGIIECNDVNMFLANKDEQWHDIERIFSLLNYN